MFTPEHISAAAAKKADASRVALSLFNVLSGLLQSAVAESLDLVLDGFYCPND